MRENARLNAYAPCIKVPQRKVISGFRSKKYLLFHSFRQASKTLQPRFQHSGSVWTILGNGLSIHGWTFHWVVGPGSDWLLLWLSIGVYRRTESRNLRVRYPPTVFKTHTFSRPVLRETLSWRFSPSGTCSSPIRYHIQRRRSNGYLLQQPRQSDSTRKHPKDYAHIGTLWKSSWSCWILFHSNVVISLFALYRASESRKHWLQVQISTRILRLSGISTVESLCQPGIFSVRCFLLYLSFNNNVSGTVSTKSHPVFKNSSSLPDFTMPLPGEIVSSCCKRGGPLPKNTLNSI